MIQLRADALKKWRGDESQLSLAKRSGVSRGTIIRIENGHAESVTLDTINRLAEALGCDADVLVAFDR
jgi:transcriptional regulator with XRE-family HTH domain